MNEQVQIECDVLHFHQALFYVCTQTEATPHIIVSSDLVDVWDGGQNIQPLLYCIRITYLLSLKETVGGI